MGSGKYVFDKDNFKFKKEKRTLRSKIAGVFKFFIVTLSLSVVYYILFSLFISTDTERRLKNENEVFSKVYPEMQHKQRLLEDVVTGLEVKDGEIYKAVFNTEVPAFDRSSSSDFWSVLSDSILNADILKYEKLRLDAILDKQEKVTNNFEEIYSKIGVESVLSEKQVSEPGLLEKQQEVLESNLKGDFEELPMSLPIDGLTYAQIGASVGKKINPFYKVMVQHNGLDLIAAKGDIVRATADGTVKLVKHSRRGQGNVVEIEHKNGYITRYAHFADIKVVRGRKVVKGQRIGSVGVSGKSFAPHLHYEILRDGKYLDPVNFFFASVTPEEYFKMVYMAANTGQSMD